MTEKFRYGLIGAGAMGREHIRNVNIIDHAEIIALKNAGPLSVGADLYITLEPCNHQGKTPPCTEKIISAGIINVFIAMKDPNPLVNGLGVNHLKKNGINLQLKSCTLKRNL